MTDQFVLMAGVASGLLIGFVLRGLGLVSRLPRKKH